jgi:NADH-quinone oxidoreductase subunit L
VLAVLSVAGGWFKGPLLAFLNRGLPPLVESRAGLTEIISGGIAALAFLIGLLAAYALYIRKRDYALTIATSGLSRALHAFWFEDWGFDRLYDSVFVRPFLWVASISRHDAVDRVFALLAQLNRDAHTALSLTESGRLRWYAAGIGAGAVIFLGVVLLR